MGKLLLMSHKELKRLEVIQEVFERRFTQRKGAEILEITDRHMRRLMLCYLEDGPEGLTSKRRGKPSNNNLTGSLKARALELIRENYYDFGPTLACEKLREVHNLCISVGSIRKLMIEADLWLTRSKRAKRAYQPRYRRECYGELIQIDGSDHEWFEDRAPRCTLLVAIDDATSKLMGLRFVQYESTFTYFDFAKHYLEQHGKPVAFYSDKFSVFKVSQKIKKEDSEATKFDYPVQ